MEVTTVPQKIIQTPIIPNATLLKTEAPTLRMVAMHDYVSRKENILSIVKGQIIIVLKQRKSGWWKGKLENGQVGKFPSNFCKIIDDSVSNFGQNLSQKIPVINESHKENTDELLPQYESKVTPVNVEENADTRNEITKPRVSGRDKFNTTEIAVLNDQSENIALNSTETSPSYIEAMQDLLHMDSYHDEAIPDGFLTLVNVEEDENDFPPNYQVALQAIQERDSFELKGEE